MALSIYKPGQGYYTRMLTAVGAGTIVVLGVAWLWPRLEGFSSAIYYQVGLAIALIGGAGGLLWFLLNKPRIADFMIATEGEMKKVNWPTRREVVGSTVVVIGGTLFIAGLLFVIDLFFGAFFQAIHVLET